MEQAVRQGEANREANRNVASSPSLSAKTFTRHCSKKHLLRRKSIQLFRRCLHRCCLPRSSCADTLNNLQFPRKQREGEREAAPAPLLLPAVALLALYENACTFCANFKCQRTEDPPRSNELAVLLSPFALLLPRQRQPADVRPRLGRRNIRAFCFGKWQSFISVLLHSNEK